MRAHLISKSEALLRRLAVVACLMLVACAEELELDGRNFLLQDTSTGFTPLPESIVVLSFDGDRLAIYAGCNTLDGEYRVEDDKLHMRGAGSTDIGCDTARSMQDQWLTSFITSKPHIDLDGDRLVLRDSAAELDFLDRDYVGHLGDADRLR